MSRKTLNIADIQNELETGSSFFPSRAPVAQKASPRRVKQKPSKSPPKRPIDTPPPAPTPPIDASPRKKNKGSNDVTTPRSQDVTNDAMTSTPQSRTQDPTTASSNDTTVSRHHDTTPPPIEPIRRAVKQIGKEAATHRFTVAEKRAIADIVYTLGQQGYRTSENEIARIAINSLLLDYKEHGEQSILYQVIKALNE